MLSDYSLKHVGAWVTDLAAISCLGAGLAAVVLTLIPGKRLTGKAEGGDPSSFIDPGAGETARYRLAYKDLVTVKNTSLDATIVSQPKPVQPEGDGANLDVTSVQSAVDLALTMFDQGVLGAGNGEKSQAATKQMSKTKVEKTRVEPKKSETKKESKSRAEPKAKGKSDPKKDKGGQKPGVESSMAVRKVTYGPKATRETSLPGTAGGAIEELPAQSPISPDEQVSGYPFPHYQIADQFSGQFPEQARQFPQAQQPGFLEHDVTEFQHVLEEESQPAPAPAPIVVDPIKDPKKVGRATLIEPKSKLQGGEQPKNDDREPPPLEYFK